MAGQIIVQITLMKESGIDVVSIPIILKPRLDKSNHNPCIILGAQNGTLLGMVITGFLWLVLAIYSVMTRDSDVYRDEFDDYTNYRENVPMVHTGTSSPATDKQQQPHQNYFVPSKPAN